MLGLWFGTSKQTKGKRQRKCIFGQGVDLAAGVILINSMGCVVRRLTDCNRGVERIMPEIMKSSEGLCVHFSGK